VNFLDVRLNNLVLTPGSLAVAILAALQNRGVYVVSDQINSPPALFPIENQIIPPNQPVDPVTLQFFDYESDPCTLSVSATSSNPALVPASSLALVGFCNNISLIATPTPGVTGLTAITVTVTDPLGAATNVTFTIEVLVDAPVSINNPDLEAVLRAMLQKPYESLTLYDLRNLQYLYAADMGISSLYGLESAINLLYADLSRNQITDASVLGGLTNLQSVLLDGNKIGNIQFTSSLNQLVELSLRDTGIQDINPLGHKLQLGMLDLSYNLISNVQLITGLPALWNLKLDGVGLHDISFLTNLPALQVLSIANNDIADLSPLLAMPNLNFVDISGNGLNLAVGSGNAAVIAILEGRGVSIPSLDQTVQPAILPGSPYLSPPDKMALEFSSIPGRTYTIQASSNLVDWIDLAVVSSKSPTSGYTNSDGGLFNQRFYRVQASSALPKMVIGDSLSTTNGKVTLPVFGVGSRPIALQTSADLINWNSLPTNRALNGSVCVDGTATNVTKRFYRLLAP
jgi:hypothetical protein